MRVLLGSSVLAVLAACGQPSEVQLRLYRCVEVELPRSVELAIQSYGGDGEALGAVLLKSFEIPDPRVFSDGYATVGFVPPIGTVRADITVTWVDGTQEAVASFMKIAVPSLGEVLELGDEGCLGGAETTGSTSSGGWATDTTGTGGETGSTTTSTSGTSTSQGETTSSTGTGDASTTGTGTTGTTGMGTTTGPNPGEDCPGKEGNVECSDGIGKVGQFVKCIAMKWEPVDPPCEDLMVACMGVVMPQLVGCFGEGPQWACVCVGTPGEPCMTEGETSCEPGMDSDKLDVCLPDKDMMLVHHVGYCAQCGDVNGQTTCVPP